jgi:hypothetical protein
MGYMRDEHSFDDAARLESRTKRLLALSGAMFVIWQAAYFLIFRPTDDALRHVDMVASVGFIAWGAALLMLLATGGGALKGRNVREILDDELARANRRLAYQHGFWALMLVSLVAYIAASFTLVSARALAHVSLSAGVVVTVATVVRLNRHYR